MYFQCSAPLYFVTFVFSVCNSISRLLLKCNRTSCFYFVKKCEIFLNKWKQNRHSFEVGTGLIYKLSSCTNAHLFYYQQFITAVDMFAAELIHLHDICDRCMMFFGYVPETVAGFYDIPGNARLFFVLF